MNRYAIVACVALATALVSRFANAELPSRPLVNPTTRPGELILKVNPAYLDILRGHDAGVTTKIFPLTPHVSIPQPANRSEVVMPNDVPPTWSKHWFNGMTYYIVPLGLL